MFTFGDMKNVYANRQTVGRRYRDDSRLAVDLTWNNDVASRECYIYDYDHDDQPLLNRGMTYENTTKTKIDAKFLVTTYGSFSKDQPEVHVQFRPYQKTYNFDQEDELYYLNKRSKRYGIAYPFVGLYIDIPNNEDIYEKWMICLMDVQDQFQKYFVLPCRYQFCWIRNDNGKRIKQKMWGVLRSQSSYNSGLWTDHVTTTRENQELAFLPTNSISDSIWYISEDNNYNQRLIVDVPNEHPNTWQVSKVEKVNVQGRTKLTLYQTEFNPHSDFIEKDVDDNIVAMWADYYSTTIEPVEMETPSINIEETPIVTTALSLKASTNTIKVGGSYKLITASFEDVEDYNGKQFVWSAYIGGEELDNSLITWLEQPDKNKIKLKFANDRKYLGKILEVKCDSDGTSSSIQFELVV